MANVFGQNIFIWDAVSGAASPFRVTRVKEMRFISVANAGNVTYTRDGDTVTVELAANETKTHRFGGRGLSIKDLTLTGLPTGGRMEVEYL